MGHWWYRNIVEPGKLPLLLALASFVLTFLVTRVRHPPHPRGPGAVPQHHARAASMCTMSCPVWC